MTRVRRTLAGAAAAEGDTPLSAPALGPRSTATALFEMLRLRFAPPEWCVQREVTIEGRRLDALAFNLWGARSWRLVGFEIKLRRADWLRELGAFEKSEPAAHWCDTFYVVTPPKLVRPDELPEGWGLLEIAGSRLITRRQPQSRTPPTTMPRELAARFVARMVHECTGLREGALWKARHDVRQEIEESLRAKSEQENGQLHSELAKLRAEHEQLIRALGVDRYAWPQMEPALRAAGILAACERDGERLRTRLQSTADEIGRHHRHLTEALASLGAA